MILNNDLTLEAVLAGAVSANQPDFHVQYRIWTETGVPSPWGTTRGQLNGSTDVTLLSPSANGYSQNGYKAEIGEISIYNKDTAPVIVTIKDTDGSTERIFRKKQLAVGQELFYGMTAGLQIV